MRIGYKCGVEGVVDINRGQKYWNQAIIIIKTTLDAIKHLEVGIWLQCNSGDDFLVKLYHLK